MTTYLTKIIDGRTHHFRITLKNDGVDIVEGVFYNWIAKSFQKFENSGIASIKKDALIAEKIREGFQETKFKESLENTADVYDKAKWHFEEDFPKELDIFQGYVHTGLFLGWLVDRDLISDEFKNDNEAQIKMFKERQITGPQIFENCCDGVLIINDIKG